MKLDDVIKGMILQKQKNSVTLKRGLVLAYTPDYQPNIARLTWSRREIQPSFEEDRIVRDSVIRMLSVIGYRAVVGGPYFVGGQNILDGWGSSILTWRWIDAVNLWSLEGDDFDRAKAWIEGKKIWYEK